jgi:hypothetical protein
VVRVRLEHDDLVIDLETLLRHAFAQRQRSRAEVLAITISCRIEQTARTFLGPGKLKRAPQGP